MEEHKINLDDKVLQSLGILNPGCDLVETDFCEYIYKCNPKKVCFKDNSHGCEVKKFYDRYGIDYEKMFIGSKK